MSMYSQFKTDTNIERDGLWLEYGSFRVKIARAGGANKKFQIALEKNTSRYRRAIDTQTIDPMVAESLIHKTYAEAVVLAWEILTDPENDVWTSGIEAEDGSIMEFNVENVVSVFRTLPDLFRDIQDQAQRVALFRADISEAAQGN